MTHEQLVRDYLTLGNRYKRLVKIKYRYLRESLGRREREGYIQPLEFTVGKKGLHVRAWDVEKNDYRQFAVANIQEISLTDLEWTKVIKPKKLQSAK